MKLSDLSHRDYIAIEVAGHFAGKMPDNEAAFRAYSLADHLLRAAGKYQDRVADAEAKAERAETKYATLLNIGPDVAARIALTQLWETLGVDNQTAAVQALDELRGGIRECLDAERRRQADLKPGAPASQYTAARVEKLERLVR